MPSLRRVATSPTVVSPIKLMPIQMLPKITRVRGASTRARSCYFLIEILLKQSRFLSDVQDAERKGVQDKQPRGQVFRHLGFSLVFIFSFVPSGVHQLLLCRSTTGADEPLNSFLKRCLKSSIR